MWGVKCKLLPLKAMTLLIKGIKKNLISKLTSFVHTIGDILNNSNDKINSLLKLTMSPIACTK